MSCEVLASDASSVASSNPQPGASSQRGPRKGSADKSIRHTRMEDDAVHSEYTFGETIGEGSFGKVFKAQHVASSATVAIKEIVKEKVGYALSC